MGPGEVESPGAVQAGVPTLHWEVLFLLWACGGSLAHVTLVFTCEVVTPPNGGITSRRAE